MTHPLHPLPLTWARTCDHTLDVPKRSTPFAAGYDLPLCLPSKSLEANDPDPVHAITLWAGDQHIARTGWAVAIPQGYVGFVWPRSGLAVQYGLSVGAGVIDSDYRGEIKVVLQRVVTRDGSGFNAAPLNLYHGDRIGQLVICRHLDLDSKEVDRLPITVRGTDGFGSTGR